MTSSTNQNLPDKIWLRFIELLSLDLHDGDERLAKARPIKVLLGSVESHKKFFDQAIKEVLSANLLG